jgi:GNAT superfamily N-acetyltransferase
VSVRTRLATVHDFAGIAEVAIATDQAGEGAAADPRYADHLLRRGRLVVAEGDDEVVGYAATIVVNHADVLADLFVTPGCHGGGVGKALLDAVWSGAPDRMTLSSSHPSALPLYIRHGLIPRWPVLYLRGAPDRLPPAQLTLREVDVQSAVQHEKVLTGVDRGQDYEYWASRPRAQLVVVRNGDEVVAVGAVGGEGLTYGLSHLVSSHSSHAAESVVAVLGSLDGEGLVAIPGPHPGVAPLVGSGWRIVDVDMFAATDDHLVDPQLVCPHSGLM